MLPLPQVEKGHYGGLLVLGGISFEDLGDELLVDGIELERYRGIVVGCVSVLDLSVSVAIQSRAVSLGG